MMIKILARCVLTMMILSGCGGSKTTVRPEVDAHGQRAYRNFMSGDLNKAAAQYKRGHAAARSVDDVAVAAQYLANIGRVYAEMEQHDSAALYLAAAHLEFTALSNTAAASKTAATLAVSVAMLGDGETANRWYAAAYGNRGKDDKHYYAVIKGLMDWRLSSRIDDQAALSDAIKYYTKKKDHSAAATIYILTADMEFAQGNCAASERNLQDALSSVDKTNELYRRSGILLKLSAVKFCTGDDSAGRRYYNRAKDCAPRGVTLQPIEDVSNCAAVCRK